ncbi:MAG: NOL1/NOP2/sun family putative RNA methylase [Anaerolineaceae bacterium]|nr:NOL1/NOP2/sun family putative RNA methylase [Anaerolineaceae bacterium]MBN2678137.1 NOL1/NOP2/sun family putative RNA methylase [Anaerolineaceae bacterium]
MKNKKVPVEPAKVDPAEILERYRALVPAGTFTCIAQGLGEPLPPALRVNRLQGIDKVIFSRWQTRYGWEVQTVPFCSSGWQVFSAATPPSQTVEHLMGAFYIQEASSMIPPEMFDYDPSHPELVLDLAASPGGKTTHLCDKMGDQGLVIANDASRSRIQALHIALERWGAINAAVTCQPGEYFGTWFPGVFDKVLIDAPCSMEGLRTTDSHPMRAISKHERDSLANRQIRLLTSALQAVRNGGQVVYATCTLAPEEDELVLLAIKKRFGTAVEILSPHVGIQAPALPISRTAEYPDIMHSLRIWPHLYNTAGFFAALIRKNSAIDDKADIRPPRWSSARRGWTQMNSKMTGELAGIMLDQYGFNLTAVVERQRLTFWKRDQRIQAIPEIFLTRFADFPVISAGLEVGRLIAGNLQPSHEWAARFNRQFNSGQLILPAEQTDNWMKGNDVQLSIPGGNHQGRVLCLINEDGQFLGRCKVLPGRIKNLLPRRLVV